MGEETKYTCLHSYLEICEKIEEYKGHLEQMIKLRNDLEKHIELEYKIRSKDLWTICNR